MNQFTPSVSDEMDDSGTLADTTLERFTRALAGRSSRRSILGKASQFLLGFLGIEVLTAKPVDARAVSSSFQPPCTTWYYCGAYGHPCSHCGGTDSGCPTGCTQSTSFWEACCQSPSGQSYKVKYFDCCTNNEANQPTCSDKCENGNCVEFDAAGNKIAWCAPGLSYYCCSVIYSSSQTC